MVLKHLHATNDDLVNDLKSNGALMTRRIIRAFKDVDRRLFAPKDLQEEAYGDWPLEIGHGQTLSQPTTVATMLEMAYPKPGDNVLDIGSGSGWTSALLARIVGLTGQVHATEIRPDLYDLGRSNLDQLDFSNLESHYTPDQLGWPAAAPYQRIIVSAAGSSVPSRLLDQLAAPGTMVLPINDSLSVVQKDASGTISEKQHYGYAFVPLIYQNA